MQKKTKDEEQQQWKSWQLLLSTRTYKDQNAYDCTLSYNVMQDSGDDKPF